MAEPGFVGFWDGWNVYDRNGSGHRFFMIIKIPADVCTAIFWE